MPYPENLRHVARIVVVNPDGSILFHRRPADELYGANQLSLIGGKFDPTDLTRKHAAQRELREELGLKNKIPEFLLFFSQQSGDWFTHAFILLLDKQFDLNQLPQHDEFSEVMAIKPDQIEQYFAEMAFDHAQIVQAYLQLMER